MAMDHETLVRLHEKLETERRRILADQTLAENERLPAQFIHELADIGGAARRRCRDRSAHTEGGVWRRDLIRGTSLLLGVRQSEPRGLRQSNRPR
jgi:hypothetical protein